jgi:predicted phage replisome organizer
MSSTRYYWLKLDEDFFERDEIRLVEAMPNGKDYIIFYMKLLLKGLKTEGKLLLKNIIPYTPEMLATITNTNIDVAKAAIKLFSELQLLDILDDGTLYMMEVENMLGSESDSAKRMRNKRKKDAELKILENIPSHCDQNVQHCDQNVKTCDQNVKEKHKNYEQSHCYSDEKKRCTKLEKTVQSQLNSDSNKKQKFKNDSQEIKLSKQLFEKMKINNQNAKEPDFQKWAKHIDFMIRIDKRKVEDIEKVIDWCQEDSFWYSNILSTAKLRKQFDALILKSSEKKKAVSKNTPSQSTNYTQRDNSSSNFDDFFINKTKQLKVTEKNKIAEVPYFDNCKN